MKGVALKTSRPRSSCRGKQSSYKEINTGENHLQIEPFLSGGADIASEDRRKTDEGGGKEPISVRISRNGRHRQFGESGSAKKRVTKLKKT